MSFTKITEVVYLCTCDLKDCVGIDPKTRKPKPWKSYGEMPPDRCRWCGRRTWDGRDLRPKRLITVKGKTKSIAQWARETGISGPTIRARLDLFGWSEADAVSVPANGERKK
jgi:hypothetical protein